MKLSDKFLIITSVVGLPLVIWSTFFAYEIITTLTHVVWMILWGVFTVITYASLQKREI